jgi:tetratricopeptide (TPR) repeat protein
MSHSIKLTLLVALALPCAAAAQNVELERPKPYVGPPPTQKELDRRESLYQFTFGLLCEKEDRLLEALAAFEMSAKLDSEAAAPLRAQVPLLLLLDRPRDALARCQQALKIDENDHDVWFISARLHKSLGEMKEYRNAIDRGLAVPGLTQNQPQLAQQLYFELGHHLENAGDLAAAVAAYSESAKILDHPDAILDHGPFVRESIVSKAGETYERIGNLQAKLKKYDAAIRAFQTAQMRRPDSAWQFNLSIARLYAEKNAPAEALAAVERYLKMLPQEPPAYELKIDLLSKLGRGKEIAPWLERVAAADKTNVTVRLLLAKHYAQERRFPQASDTYLSLADDAPSEDVYRAMFRLNRLEPGRFMLAQFDRACRIASKKADDPEKRIAEAEKAQLEANRLRAAEQARAMINVFREDAPLAKQLLDAAFNADQADRDLNYETRVFLAMLADKNGKLAQAEHFYREALETPGQGNEAVLYSGLLRILWKAKKYDDVIRLCEDGLKHARNTNAILFHSELAKAFARKGRFREAEAAAKKSVDLASDRDVLYARHLHVRILVQAEKYAQAEAICKKLLEEHNVPGEVVEIRYLLSNVYSGWKKLEQCEAQLQEVLKIDPTNATANNDLGYMWADHHKNLKEAEELIRKAIDLDRQQRKTGPNEDQDNAAYVDSLGWVLFRRGDFDGACKELERAVGLPDGDDPTLWDHLGDVYMRMGRLNQAQSAFERSVELFEEGTYRKNDERFRDVRRKLEQVKTQVRAK